MYIYALRASKPQDLFIVRMDEMLATRIGNALYVMLILVMDGFKLINDSFGHASGDQVLIDAARAIRSVLRDSDFVCSMGGDEFLICLSDIPNKDAILKKAKQILALMHGVAKFEVNMSVSAGIAICPDDGNTFETLYPKVIRHSILSRAIASIIVLFMMRA